MNWGAIGALAELVGAIGVVASLVYLASQIRQNTSAMRGTAHESSVARNTTWAVAIGSNSQVADVISRGSRDYQGLQTSERHQFGYMAGAAILGAEATYLQYKRGNLEEAVWQRSLESLLSFFALPGVQSWWKASRAGCTPEFKSILDTAVEEA